VLRSGRSRRRTVASRVAPVGEYDHFPVNGPTDRAVCVQRSSLTLVREVSERLGQRTCAAYQRHQYWPNPWRSPVNSRGE
jgi:hypothetical protein